MAEKEEYSAKNLIKVIDKTEVQEMVNKIKSADNKTQVAIELAVFGFNYCDKLKEKNIEIYRNNVAPKLVRLEHIKKKLEADGLTPENEDKLLTELVEVEKEIKDEAKEYNKSIMDKIGLFGGGVSIGVIATLVITSIFGGGKK